MHPLGVMVEFSGVKLKAFTYSWLICQGCLRSPMLYVLALEPVHFKLRVNPVHRGLRLPDAITKARFAAYADDNSPFVMSSADIEVVRQKVEMYQEPNLTVKSWLFYSWVHGNVRPFPATSAERMVCARYNEFRSRAVENWSEVWEIS